MQKDILKVLKIQNHVQKINIKENCYFLGFRSDSDPKH